MRRINSTCGESRYIVSITPPTNLRLLSDLYGNPLQEDKIARPIDSREEVKAHGPRDMPVWGERFFIEKNGNERQVKERIASLVAYLQSLQTGLLYRITEMRDLD